MQLQELKQRALGNMDEPFLNPGINEKQPLHVVMVSLISTCNLCAEKYCPRSVLWPGLFRLDFHLLTPFSPSPYFSFSP